MSARSERKRQMAIETHGVWVKQPETGFLDDVDLAAAATDAVRVLTTVPSEALQITAHKGWLRLEGKVHWRNQRAIVMDVTRNLPGVRGITDAIVIDSQALR